MAVFGVVVPCSLVNVYLLFRGLYYSENLKSYKEEQDWKFTVIK